MIPSSNKAIVCIEGHQKVPYSGSCKSICSYVVVISDGKLKPVPHHLVYHDVKESGGEESTLSGTSYCLKRRAIEASLSACNLLLTRKPAE